MRTVSVLVQHTRVQEDRSSTFLCLSHVPLDEREIDSASAVIMVVERDLECSTAHVLELGQPSGARDVLMLHVRWD